MKWNADLYDDKHGFVSQFGANVLELLDVKPGESVLDIGCGTGDLTKHIQESGAEVMGTDYSPEMIAQARFKYPEINFEVANAADFKVEYPYDAVFSNAALHWIHNSGGVIKSVYEALKPGGRFVAEMGGKGNVGKLRSAIKQVLQKHGYTMQAETHIWYFPSLGEYTSLLERHGFRVTYAVHFDRKTPLQDGSEGVSKWIKMFGQQYFTGIPEAEQQKLLQEITTILEPHYNENGQWYADYKRLRFTAVKEI
jgi:trans-aconitate methyltransferase